MKRVKVVTQNIQIGNVKVVPVFELDASEVIQDIIPDATVERLQSMPWLQPHYVDQHWKLKAHVQSFVLEAGSKNVLVDACIGNGRSRPELVAWSNLQTQYLENLKKAGYKPEDVDLVICTHLHFDHVGWNTTLVDGKWLPTFPNARYIFVKDEYDYWMNNPIGELVDDLNGIAESVRPLAEAGLVDLVSPDAKIIDELSLIPTPGHTPHHVSVLIQSAGQTGVITGDVFHHPCQIAHPEWMSFDSLPETALATRRAFLDRFASSGAVVINPHFAYPAWGIIERVDDNYIFTSAKER